MTVYDRLASTDDGRRRLARARLRHRVLGSLHSALGDAGLTKTELAKRLGIRKSAVSQVFGGDGNLRVNTIADYLFELGQEVELHWVPVGVPREKAVGVRPVVELVWDNGTRMGSICNEGRVRPETVRTLQGPGAPVACHG